MRNSMIIGAALVVTDLDRRYPGLRFRIIDEQSAFRPHMRFFVNGEISARSKTSTWSDIRSANRASAKRRLGIRVHRQCHRR